ncbi:MAG: hypothetical protein KC431_10145, partial [Myxococcales bacterium]|nr:hypothetical protein [Myxococcales bacterium]
SAAAELAGGNSLLKVDEQGTSRIHNHGDGNAEVAANKGGRTRLARGMGVKVEVDRRASKPIPLPPTPGWVDAPRIFLAVPGHQSMLRGSWAPITAANSYFVEVARDVEGVDVISAVEVPASTQDFEIHGLPVGSYHVRVAAVDADQFESIPSDALDLELIAVDLLGPGGVAAAWPEDDATSPRPSVLPGTTFELPPGIRCSGSDGRLDARPLLLRPGVHEASCEDDQGRPVVAFPIEVVDLGVGLGDTGDLAGEIVRGQISTHEIRVAPPSGLALPSTLHVQAPAGVEVRAVEAVDEGGEPGLWRLTLLAGPEAPAEVALGLSFVDPDLVADAPAELDTRFSTVTLQVVEPPVAESPPPAPERHMVELGLAGGLLFIAPDHGLYRPSTSEHRPLRRPAGELVLRAGYYPLRWTGIEVAGRIAPTATDQGERALVWSLRASLVGQLPYRVTPFVLVGAEALGVSSSAAALGSDTDFGVVVGGGVKFYASRRVALRLGASGMFHEAFGDGRTSHAEVDLGLSVVLGRRSPGRK